MPTNRMNQRVAVSPVAMVCATVAFGIALAGFIILVLYAPREAELYLRPIIGTMTTIGTGAVIWWRTARAEVQHSAENAVIIEKTDDAATNAKVASTKAETAADTVDKRLNGELDRRLREAVREVMNENPDAT